jgi:hypothetical protein
MAHTDDFSMANKDEWIIDASVASVKHHGQDMILTLKANTEYRLTELTEKTDFHD